MTMWDKRFGSDDYLYGTAPNDFLRDKISYLKPGKVLCIAEGEGRNAVFLAKRGFDVTAVDSSEVGLTKAKKLAEENGVEITTIVADLGDYQFEPDYWDAIVSIFAHTPPEVRKAVHTGAKSGLKPEGVFLLEAYTPDQLAMGTGGPPVADYMMTLSLLQDELDGLAFLHGEELTREVVEGRGHTGMAVVVQVIAQKI